MKKDSITARLTAVERLAAYCRVFGWQGGTIHQVVEATGCDADVLLHGELREGELSHAEGWFAIRTCSPEYRRDVLFPKRKGDVDYWHGAMCAIVISDHLQDPR